MNIILNKKKKTKNKIETYDTVKLSNFERLSNRIESN
jgi:hypothetical protein